MRPIHTARLDKTRPVLVLTREIVRPHLSRVTIAPITRTVRGLSTEVPGPAMPCLHGGYGRPDEGAVLYRARDDRHRGGASIRDLLGVGPRISSCRSS